MAKSTLEKGSSNTLNSAPGVRTPSFSGGYVRLPVGSDQSPFPREQVGVIDMLAALFKEAKGIVGGIDARQLNGLSDQRAIDG